MEHEVRMNRPRPAELEPGDRRSEPLSEPHRSDRRWLWLLALLLAAILAYWVVARLAQRSVAESSAARSAARAIPVGAVPARRGQMPVVLSGLGAVTAFNTVTVRSRVDGQLVQIGFQEGQFIEKGDLIAQIDPRPFEAELAQAEGTLARDEAQLRDARVNLERYRDLLARSFISKQQYDDQAALVGQFEGAVKVDQGAIASAKLQLLYCHITAPIAGRVGLRLVDVGNIVHATDPNGLAVITQVQPITVLFTIPEDRLPDVMRRLQSGKQPRRRSLRSLGAHEDRRRQAGDDGQPDRPDNGHVQVEGGVREPGPRSVPESVRQRPPATRGSARHHDRSDRGHPARAEGALRLCGEGGSDGGSPAGDDRSHGGQRHVDRVGSFTG